MNKAVIALGCLSLLLAAACDPGAGHPPAPAAAQTPLPATAVTASAAVTHAARVTKAAAPAAQARLQPPRPPRPARPRPGRGPAPGGILRPPGLTVARSSSGNWLIR